MSSISFRIILSWVLLASVFAEDLKSLLPTIDSDVGIVLQGTYYMPEDEIEESFQAWYDKKSKTTRTRIDYYGGMYKSYIVENDRRRGAIVNFFPFTNSTVLNVEQCTQYDWFSSNKRYPGVEILFPFSDNFVEVGKEFFKGKQTRRYIFKSVFGELINTQTLWITFRTNPNNPGSKMAIPLRYKLESRYKSSQLFQHFYVDYDSFRITNDISEEIIEISSEKTRNCYLLESSTEEMELSNSKMDRVIHPAIRDHAHYEFEGFMRTHDRKYEHQQELLYRKQIFLQNLRYINTKNHANLGFSLAINHFADKTKEEIIANLGFRMSKSYEDDAQPFPYDTNNFTEYLPDQHDWRLYGAVTHVRNQGACGSCYAFATVGAMEGANFLKTNSRIPLSEQALIDCSWEYGNLGCNGGLEEASYKWIKDMGGIPTDFDYGRYLMKEGYCHTQNLSLMAPITGFVIVPKNSPEAFKIALFKQGPLSVRVNASPKSFWFYSHGLYNDPDCDSRDLRHAVLAVGYGTMGGQQYWILKNSWSHYWGTNGYMLISAKDNVCGVMNDATYVTM